MAAHPDGGLPSVDFAQLARGGEDKAMTRWMHPPEIERQRELARFDPVVEGARMGLPRDLSLAIWERVCADATDSTGRLDTEQAQRRFRELVARIAARGGRLRPDVGRLTRVEAEIIGTPPGAWRLAELAPRIAGRETLVTREARPWRAMSAEPVGAPASTEAVNGPERDGGAADRRELPRATSELPHADEVTQALASLQLPPPLDPQGASDASERATARRRFDLDLAVWTPPGQEQRDGRLPAATLARMEQAYGQRFDDVEIHVDSAEVPAGQQAFTRGRHIYFGRGVFEPEAEHGEHVIAHELAHVAQQRRPADGDRPPTRAALESDAHQAARAALAGRTAMVSLFAPPSAALGFSNGEPQQRPAPAPGATDRPPAQSARGGTPGRAPGGPQTPGGPRTSGPTHAPASAGPGISGARPSATAVPGVAPHAAASTSPDAAAPRRGASADGLLVPEAPDALTPVAASRLHAIRTENQGVAAATTVLPTAEQQTDVARAAVVEPKAEQDAHAQHGVVAAVDDRPPPSPEIEAACARIRQVIRDKRPPDEDKLVDAKPREMAQEAGEQMSAGVEQRAGTVRQGYADMQQNPQGTPSTTPVPATLPPERAQTPPVDAAAGAPDPLHHDDVSLDGDVAAQQHKIQDAGMNTEAGQLVEDGPIGDARGGVGDLETMAKTDPQKVLADQAAAIAHARGDMHALQAAAEKALADARAGTVAHMAAHTTNVKGSEEQQRAAAGAQMQAIFARTQHSVDTLLQPLSKNAVARWEAGVAQLSTDFETSLAEVKKKIEDRHSGILGGLTELGDDAFGLPSWVTEDYDVAEARFADGATSLITDISRDVNQVIDDCKKLIDQARKDIETIVHSLPASLQRWAQGEADKLGKQLDQLSQRVDQTQRGLDQDLIHRANGAVQTVRERVADLREQAKGLLGKIADALIEFARNPAKAIVDGLLRLLAIPPASFWALVDKLGDVISGIAADPKKFANTLMSGVGQGFQQFFHNLPIHLGQSLFQWLFSKMSDAGIQMPLDFTMPSILTLVFEVMGITWPRIKTILAKHIGAENTEVLDQAHQLISTLIARGPLGVYHLVQQHLDPGMIIDAIKNAAISYVMEAIITRVAARIIMMLNPAGAILQAIEAIYRVIKWVIDNAARIFTLIEAVVNGAAQILAGNVSGVANLVERALGLLLVPVIDFLADYLGLSGIPNAIKNVIMALQSKVEQILDKVIGFLVEKAKALWQAMKSRGKSEDKNHDKDKKDERTPEEKQKALDDAVTALQPKVDALMQKGITRPELEKKLTAWAHEYRLTSLTLEGTKIIAKINPTREMYTASEVQVGKELEKILQSAEAQYLQVSTAKPSSASRLAAARAAVQAGTPIPVKLNQDEMVTLLREARAGAIPTNLTRDTRQGYPRQILTDTTTQGYQVQISDREAGKSQTTGSFTTMQDLYVPQTGSYMYEHTPDQPMPGTPGSTIKAPWTWPGGPGPVNIAHAKDQGMDGIHGLRDDVETARATGNLVANRVAQSIVAAHGATDADMTYGRMAPMATGYSALAGDIDSFKGTRPSTVSQKAVDDARGVRHGSYAVIFQTLLQTLESHPVDLLSAPGGQAASELATKFKQWLDAAFKDGKLQETDDANKAVHELQAHLIKFLQSTQPA